MSQIFSFIPFGKTGIGKSTFLNFISNSNKFKTSSGANSCTKEITEHQFQMDGAIIHTIDSIGLYDNKGSNEDQKNMKKLVVYLKQCQYGLNGIGIVISVSDCRLNSITKKAIKLLYQFIGNNLWSHLCIIVTHCPCYQDDLAEIEKSMTSGPDSLKSEIIRLIKGISQISQEPSIPFFFVDSLHPNSSPSRETLPLFKSWLFGLTSLKTNNLNEPDVNYQFKERRCKTEKSSGYMCPIYKIIQGETTWKTVTRQVQDIEKREHYRTCERVEEYYVTRDVSFSDVISLGILRGIRNNKIKRTRTVEYQEPYYTYETVYRNVNETVAIPGKPQKVIAGYYQEIKAITKTWFAYWDYEVDIIDKNHPTYETNYQISTKSKIEYFDEQKKRLSSYYDSSKINELKNLIQ